MNAGKSKVMLIERREVEVVEFSTPYKSECASSRKV